jgi:hypothetical protein
MSVNEKANEYRGLPPPRYSLRSLLIVTTLIALFCALLLHGTPRSRIGIVAVVGMIGAHLAAAGLGERLKNLPPERNVVPTHGIQAVDESHAASQVASLEEGHLAGRRPLKWITWLCLILGIGLGAALMYAARKVNILPHNTPPAALVFGFTALMFLSGFIGFVLGSFIETLLASWRQALKRGYSPDWLEKSRRKRAG